ncbi:MAG: rhomboid family intramembrane serine protease [Kiloniellales bacterium]|nr:rhomboid family intramembrane serine protease [Kiloniellales bacterium]
MPFLPLHDDHPRILIEHPWVTWGLIAASTLIFLVEVSMSPDEVARLIYGLGMIPASVVGARELEPDLVIVPPVLTLVTAQFLHGGWMHLIANMLYLWVFGDNVEDAMGHGRFLVFYLLCGLIAGLAHIAADPLSTVPTLGASGAISGVLGAYLILFPKSRVLVPIIIFPLYLPAYVLLVVWILFQVGSAAAGGPVGGGVAWWEHIGGFVAGAALVIPFRHKTVPLFAGGRLPQGIRLRPGEGRRNRARPAGRPPDPRTGSNTDADRDPDSDADKGSDRRSDRGSDRGPWG